MELDLSPGPHEKGAKTLLKLREQKLKTQMGRARYTGLLQKLLGHFAFLAEANPTSQLAKEEELAIPLCLLALQNGFSKQPEAVAEQLIDAQVLDDLEPLYQAIDIIGYPVWLPVLTQLVQDERIAIAARWQLAERYAPLLPLPNIAPLTQLTDVCPRQLSALLKQEHLSPEAAVSLAERNLDNPTYQTDFQWLALFLNKHGHAQTVPFMSAWLGAAPESPELHTAMIASGKATFAAHLQACVQMEQLPPKTLAFHGHPSHTEFCLSLLAEPRFNQTAAELWQYLTGQRLPLVPRLKDVANHQSATKDTLADAALAKQQFQTLDTRKAYFAGDAYSHSEIARWCLNNYGESSQYGLLSIWANQPETFPLLPNEHPWQRRDALRNLC